MIQAVARYYLIEANNSCEVAFVIKESKRGQGMAKTLLLEMCAIAKQRGISKMVACVRRDNKAMLKIFEYGGFAQKPSEELGEITMELQL